MISIIKKINAITDLYKSIIELSEENFTALKNSDFDKIREIDIEINLLENKKNVLTSDLISIIKEKAEQLNIDTPKISSLVVFCDSEELRDELLIAVDSMETKIEEATNVLLRNIQFAQLVMNYKNEQIEMVLEVAEREGYNARGSLIVEREI